MSLHEELAARIGLRPAPQEAPEDWEPEPEPELDGQEPGELAVPEDPAPAPPPGLLRQLGWDFGDLARDAKDWEHGWRHQFRHHQPPSPAQQALRMAEDDLDAQEMWHARWVARPGAALIAVISLLTQEPRNSRIALAVLASILTAAVIVAGTYFGFIH